jgi:single-strand DNA-binding protein
VAVDGRLEWREFETRDGGKRQAVEIVAEHVQFLSGELPSGTGGDPTGVETPEPDDDLPF